MHLKPRTAARPDTNQAHHSMFRKNFKELKEQKSVLCPLPGQVEDLFPHGSKMMAREQEGWLGAGACRDTAGPMKGALLELDAAWGPQDQMILSTGSACSHLPWYVCCCWLVFHVFRKVCAWGIKAASGLSFLLGTGLVKLEKPRFGKGACNSFYSCKAQQLTGQQGDT